MAKDRANRTRKNELKIYPGQEGGVVKEEECIGLY